MSTRPPFAWFGGKTQLARHIVELMPSHHIYVEPFGGSGAVLLAKQSSPVEVYNDLDSGLVNFYRVTSDPEKAARLHLLAARAPYSREEYLRFIDSWSQCTDDIERAYQWFYVARASFSGMFGRSWGYGVQQSSHGMAGRVSAYRSSVDLIAHVCERLRSVQVDHRDFRDVMTAYDTAETLFYFDPPYVPETRRSGDYAHELSDDDHSALVDRLLDMRGQAILSGYAHPVYERLERAKWRRVDIDVVCRAAARTRVSGLQGAGSGAKQKRVESLWLSPGIKPKRLPRTAQRPKLAHPVRATFARELVLT